MFDWAVRWNFMRVRRLEKLMSVRLCKERCDIVTLNFCVEVEAENSDSSVFHVGYKIRPPFSSQSSLKWDQLVNWARFCVHIGWFGLK